MDTKSRLGYWAALAVSATYAISAIILAVGTALEEPGDEGGMDGAAMFFTWCIITFAGSIAAAGVIYYTLKVNGGINDGLRWAAVVVGVIAAIGTFFTWAWLIWGVAFAIAFLLGVLALRKINRGFLGEPCWHDWALVAAWPIGVIVTLVLWNTDAVEENLDGLDWAYSSGFIVGAVVTGAIMLGVANALKPATAYASGPPEEEVAPGEFPPSAI